MRIRERINQLKSKLVYICSVVILLLSAISCGEREAYYKFQELKEGDWRQENVLSFEVDTLGIEKGVTYDVSLEITNNVNYAYQNLWLFSEYYKDDTTKVEKQEEFILADEFGKWTGSGFGSLYQSSHTIFRSVVFNPAQKYHIYVRHGMEDKVLHGIEKIGIKISKAK